jgi:predicted transcriptional regulator
MGLTATITARIPPELKAALEAKAQQMERSESYIINKALEAYLHAPRKDDQDGSVQGR